MPFRWDDCLELHIPLGLFFSAAAVVLLTLTSLSAPFTRLSFLDVPPPVSLRLGAFGTCPLSVSGGEGCSAKTSTLGYTVGDGAELEPWMTRTFILFPLAALFILFALLFLVLSLMMCGRALWNPVYFRVCGLISTLLALLASTFALVAFIRARHRWNTSDAGLRPTYGASLWLGLGGAGAAFLAVCLGGPQYEARYMYRAHPDQAYDL